MIKVNFFTKADGNITGFRVSGHSDYAKAGDDDIVCAAVSSAAYMTVNTVTDVLHITAEIEAEDGNMYFRVFSKDAAACRDILGGFKLHMLQLTEQYPTDINVNYTEV
ncbi:MAG TPA: ribosomal-processing cysteine protease Prp [Clostridiales bacterium]|nr:ribosomal-processing cysteine protease Prp [Clostridiales bacterium]